MFTISNSKEIGDLKVRVKELELLFARLNEALGGVIQRVEQLEEKRVLSHFSKR